MAEHHLFPDVVAVMSVEVSEVVRRLLPSRLNRWRGRRERKQQQIHLVMKCFRRVSQSATVLPGDSCIAPLNIPVLSGAGILLR